MIDSLKFYHSIKSIVNYNFDNRNYTKISNTHDLNLLIKNISLIIDKETSDTLSTFKNNARIFMLGFVGKKEKLCCFCR